MRFLGMILGGLLLIAAGPVQAGDFTDNGNGTVTDNITGLLWQQSDDYTPRNWLQAIAYCEGLSLGGRGDWRLPNVKELRSIVDETTTSPAVDISIFHRTLWSGYWTSTTCVDSSPSEAWNVYFYYGNVDCSNKMFSSYVRCVSGN